MKAVVYSFTRRGAMLSINIGEALQKFDFEVRCLTMPKFAEEKIFLEAMDDHNKACEYAFKECQLIVFVGAVGIAVRTIAPYIKNKLVDPAVLSVSTKAETSLYHYYQVISAVLMDLQKS